MDEFTPRHSPILGRIAPIACFLSVFARCKLGDIFPVSVYTLRQRNRGFPRVAAAGTLVHLVESPFWGHPFLRIVSTAPRDSSSTRFTSTPWKCAVFCRCPAVSAYDRINPPRAIRSCGLHLPSAESRFALRSGGFGIGVASGVENAEVLRLDAGLSLQEPLGQQPPAQ